MTAGGRHLGVVKTESWGKQDWTRPYWVDTKAELGTAVFFNVEKCAFSIVHVYIFGPEGMNVKHSNLNVKSCGPGLLLKPRL